jgi:CRISPR-associated protein Csb2
MFGLAIRYLNGWTMAAADGAQKQRPEWPPHPDRVFMALAAAWFETDQEASEGEALRWLALQPAPTIRAAAAESRETVTTYVPANDSDLAPTKTVERALHNLEVSVRALKEAGLAVVPDFRPRQERSFPVAVPHTADRSEMPTVHLAWETSIPADHRVALESLCRKATSVGHSASLVQMWFEASPPAPTLLPVEGIARHRLRVFGPGRLEYLAEKCGRRPHIEKADELWEREQASSGRQQKAFRIQRDTHLHGIVERLRPDPAVFQGYDAPSVQAPRTLRGSVFDPRMVVLSVSGGRLSLLATLRVTEALRGALMSAAPQPPPEWLSGHTREGGRSERPHVAFLPLPFVGRDHADGRLMGVGLAIPRELDSAEADQVLGPWLRDAHGLPRGHRLFDGRWFECGIGLDTRDSPPFNLRAETWTGPSAAWGSVTPVVLDRHSDGKNKWEHAAESVRDACERIGLPRPDDVLLHPVSCFEGAPRSSEFPPLRRKRDGGRISQTHAVLVFHEPVEGPILIGAGRYRGYGFCRPLSPTKAPR